MMEIFISIISMVGLCIFFAMVLAVADKKFAVAEDPKIACIEEALPGLNCGACGYAGCHSFAEALSRDEAPITGCLPGGESTNVKLAGILGRDKCAIIKSTAVLHCNADCTQRKVLADYKGIQECKAASRIFDGGLACEYGCLGYGDCKDVCPFGAIKMAEGLPVIDSTMCTSCGKCVKACPRMLFSVESFKDKEFAAVACSSKDKGPKVRQVCGVGCIACKICEKLSGGIFEVKDNIAVVNYKKAGADMDWNKVIEKCPTKVIVKIT